MGGPLKSFELAGRKLLIALLSEGLYPDSKVLDIGCGCLRGGYWLIHFLDRGCYCGIEPNTEMLDAGIKIILEPGIVDQKRPTFDNNSNFDFTIFKRKFDFYVARSIWTHASKQQIQTMLDGFSSTSTREGKFLTSYKKPATLNQDYKSADWVGRSHESDTPGIVHHSFEWIHAECAIRGLIAEEIDELAYNFGNQKWIRIEHKIF